jgi:hypothetical protein
MTVHRKKLVHTAAKLSALALITVGLGAWDLGCSDCGSRTEFVTRGAGDSIDANKATQTIDPWPPYVKNRKLDLAGPRAGLAMDRYQTNRVLTPHPLNPDKPAEALPVDNTLQAPAPQH